MASAGGGSLRTERRGWAEVRVGKAKKWQRQWAVVESLSLARDFFAIIRIVFMLHLPLWPLG